MISLAVDDRNYEELSREILQIGSSMHSFLDGWTKTCLLTRCVLGLSTVSGIAHQHRKED